MRTCLTFFGLLGTLFVSAQVSHNLSSNPIPICERSFVFEEYEDLENAPPASLNNSCIGDLNWLSTVWLTCKIEKGGDFAFDLIPSQSNDDIDFVVYRMNPKTINAANSKTDFTLERCMASGLRLDQAPDGQPFCKGKTGLRSNAYDLEENIGCANSDDNFLAPIQSKAGDQFLILVSNYNSEMGFELAITGSAKVSQTLCQDISTNVGYESDDIRISPLHPNPVIDKAFIDIRMAQSGDVYLHILRMDGSVVQKREMYMPAGNYQLTIPARNLVPGTYIARVRIGQEEYTNKFIKIQKN